MRDSSDRELWSRLKLGLPSSSTATTSPSMTVSSGRYANSRAMEPKCALKFLPRREYSVTLPPVFTTSMRHPSSLISHVHIAPSGSLLTGRHSFGSMNWALIFPAFTIGLSRLNSESLHSVERHRFALGSEPQTLTGNLCEAYEVR